MCTSAFAGPRIPLLLSTFALAAAACREPTGTERLLGLRAWMPALASDGTCHFDLSHGRGEAVFTTLGVLDEYQGREIVEDDDRIETCYCSEVKLAAWFGRQLRRLAAEQSIDAATRAETVQDCLTVYRSRQLAGRINSCYRYRLSSDTVVQAEDGSFRRSGKASFNRNLFIRGRAAEADGVVTSASLDRFRAAAYLTGAWARHGHGAEFVFANSPNKVQLVAQLLTALGARHVRADTDSGFIPATTRIRFDAEDDLWERFRKVATDVAGEPRPPFPHLESQSAER